MSDLLATLPPEIAEAFRVSLDREQRIRAQLAKEAAKSPAEREREQREQAEFMRKWRAEKQARKQAEREQEYRNGLQQIGQVERIEGELKVERKLAEQKISLAEREQQAERERRLAIEQAMKDRAEQERRHKQELLDRAERAEQELRAERERIERERIEQERERFNRVERIRAERTKLGYGWSRQVKRLTRVPRGYYVYAWEDAGGLFYIGKGSGERAWKPHNDQLCEARRMAAGHTWRCRILREGMSEVEAYAVEAALIELHNPACNVDRSFIGQRTWEPT